MEHSRYHMVGFNSVCVFVLLFGGICLPDLMDRMNLYILLLRFCLHMELEEMVEEGMPASFGEPTSLML